MLGRKALALVAALLVASAALAQDHGKAPTPPAKAPIFDLGPWHHPVTTNSPDAQQYFDQGLILCYGFNHAQAIASFTEATKIDPNCAMAFWGIALAYGPNINFPMDSTADQPAWEALQAAQALAPKASEADQAYIEALSARYTDPKMPRRPTRAAMDSAYAGAMRRLWKKYPTDADAGALFAESLMDLNPWNFWSLDGKAAPGTDEMVATLEAVLKFEPDHPGANHFHIHALEASPHPERAAASADRLGPLVPEAGHLVHMPGHIYQRIGRYLDSQDANVKAARIDSLYVAKYQPQSLYPMMYYPHNVHFIWAASCMEGNSALAIASARRLEPLVPLEEVRQMPVIEFATPTTYYTFVRFGRWSEMLSEPGPPMDLRFTRGMWHWARGMAYENTGKLAEARVERDSVLAIAAATAPEAMVSFNSAAALLRLAGHMLNAEIAAGLGKIDESVSFYRKAMAEEAQLHYDEPMPWFYPVRQSMGAVLLKAGRVADAEKAYREDLERNPENGWSLYGLSRCLRTRKADAEAAQVEQRFQKAWGRADVKLTASVF